MDEPFYFEFSPELSGFPYKWCTAKLISSMSALKHGLFINQQLTLTLIVKKVLSITTAVLCLPIKLYTAAAYVQKNYHINSYFNIIFVFTRMFMKFNPFMKQGKLYNWRENLVKAPPAFNKPFAPFYCDHDRDDRVVHV